MNLFLLWTFHLFKLLSYLTEQSNSAGPGNFGAFGLEEHNSFLAQDSAWGKPYGWSCLLPNNIIKTILSA